MSLLTKRREENLCVESLASNRLPFIPSKTLRDLLINAGLYFSTILVRLLRFWWCGLEPRNSRRGGELMGADMFLLDAKVTVMPATLNVHRHFRQRLTAD
ncbi:hypothetical protein IGI04_039786 [Brassica rapa subsp. trilocularis]|uniref:Uncharacterized protein n=1 Tax=Brassica rapa subsp. trilocularis TaxID=1813537 RepID=A0ABQ7KNT5_BRACM|nr:hypothetical protein IGI04_039786 [Brassica rapa subsp. trilocularis]